MDAEAKTSSMKMAVNTTLGAGGAVIASLTLNEWVSIVTIVYLAMQIFLLLPKYRAYFRETFRKRREGR